MMHQQDFTPNDYKNKYFITRMLAYLLDLETERQAVFEQMQAEKCNLHGPIAYQSSENLSASQDILQKLIEHDQNRTALLRLMKAYGDLDG